MKTVTIDELLTWAFVHELPKGGGIEGLANPNSAWRMLEASSWGKIASFAELMTVIDAEPGDASNFFIEQGAPHDDALALGQAVAGLSAFDIEFAPDWKPLADWQDQDAVFAGLTRDAEARAREAFMVRTPLRRSAHIVNLVVGQAILGGQPDIGAEPRKVKIVDRRGKPAWFVKKSVIDPTTGEPHEMEVDGFDVRKCRPLRNAYRKYEFSDDPRGDILGRLDYQIWVAALCRLHRVVGPLLTGHRLVHSDLSMTPWLEREARGVALVERAAK